MRRDSKREAHIHTTAVMLYRRIEKFVDLSKGYDFIEFLSNFALGHTEYGAVQEDILSSGEFGMEARSDFQQAGNPPLQSNPARCRLGDAAQNLEERALTRAILPNNTDDFAPLDVEANVFQ